MNYTPITFLTFCLMGCQNISSKNSVEQSSTIAAPTTSSLQEKTQCSVYATRDWSAIITPSTNVNNRYQLSITGEVDLPSPAYQVNWTEGITDRAMPPNLRLSLTTERSHNQASIQVISPTKVHYQLETPLANFKSITILCADEVLATIAVTLSSSYPSD
ncbi:hypothetical protein [Vibrio sp. MA40-2]|uniref:hypothetical protein n=1 Tax=Vibrio sp. MA40-2 TaxID=3391828 RepID=UPI0039A6C9E2